MPNPIKCEPILDLPQIVDLDILRYEQLNVFKKESEESKVHENEQETKDLHFDVLPLIKSPHEHSHLSNVLSLKTNKYLYCKFDKFLGNWTKEWVTVRLFRELKPQPPKPRRMKLNGGFYDVDFKLAPVPYLPDPRKPLKP